MHCFNDIEKLGRTSGLGGGRIVETLAASFSHGETQLVAMKRKSNGFAICNNLIGLPNLPPNSSRQPSGVSIVFQHETVATTQ